MPKTAFQSVDEYIASQPQASQRLLRRVRTILRGALPQAEESISYEIPTYKIDGRAVIYFAGWQNHYSLYPLGKRVIDTLAKELAPYEMAKGTIRFSYAERMPTHLIQRIAKLRAEAAASERPKKRQPPTAKTAPSRTPPKKSPKKSATTSPKAWPKKSVKKPSKKPRAK